VLAIAKNCTCICVFILLILLLYTKNKQLTSNINNTISNVVDGINNFMYITFILLCPCILHIIIIIVIITVCHIITARRTYQFALLSNTKIVILKNEWLYTTLVPFILFLNKCHSNEFRCKLIFILIYLIAHKRSNCTEE